MRSGLSTRSRSDAGSALKGCEVGGVDRAPVVQQEWGGWVGVGHLDGAVEPEVPFTVGEVEDQGVGRRPGQVVLGDEPGVAGRPDGSVRRGEPEPAAVLVANTRLLAPGDAFCDAWSAGVTSTRTGSIWNMSPMSWPTDGRFSCRISEATYCVEWNVSVTSARSRQVGTL